MKANTGYRQMDSDVLGRMRKLTILITAWRKDLLLMNSNAASLSIPHPNREQALRKARLTAGFPNIVNGQKIDFSRQIKISDPVTGEELASVSTLKRTVSTRRFRVQRRRFPFGAERPGTSEGIFFDMPWKSSEVIPMSFALS